MSIRLDALAIARAELRAGAREIGGNNRGKWVRKYLAGAGLDEGHAWCASFVSWCFQQVEGPMPFPYSPGVKRFFNMAVKRGWEVAIPQPGDLVVWSRGAANSGLGHIGFVEYAHHDLIQTIEGNHTSTVARFKYEWDEDKRLLGFIRVPG